MNDIERAFGDEEEGEPAPHDPDCKCVDCRPDLLAADLAEEERLYQEYVRNMTTTPEETPAPQPEYTHKQLAKMREIVEAFSQYGIGGLMPPIYVDEARELVRQWGAEQEARDLVQRHLREPNH